MYICGRPPVRQALPLDFKYPPSIPIALLPFPPTLHGTNLWIGTAAQRLLAHPIQLLGDLLTLRIELFIPLGLLLVFIPQLNPLAIDLLALVQDLEPAAQTGVPFKANPVAVAVATVHARAELEVAREDELPAVLQ